MSKPDLKIGIDLNKAITANITTAFAGAAVNTDLLRLDLIHPVVSGNKWFKLKEHLQLAQKQNASTLLSFGGAYSNHIVAVAFAAAQQGLKSIGIIRGEKTVPLSPTLQDALDYNMELVFVPRNIYKNREALLSTIHYNKEKTYLINEGGAGEEGIKGAESILDLVDKEKYSHICCAVGTGTMMAGIIRSAMPYQKIIGISSLKGRDLLTNEIAGCTKGYTAKFELLFDFHFGGYAKKTPELLHFMNQFYTKTGIGTDFVYTGKLLYAVSQLVQNGYFNAHDQVLVIHSGGLQGNRSLLPGTLLF